MRGRFLLSLSLVIGFCAHLAYAGSSVSKYTPQRVHINRHFVMELPRDWVRRPNIPAPGLAALFAPNLDIRTPNVSVLILKEADDDPLTFTRALINRTPGAKVNHLFKKNFGDNEAVVSDVTAQTQDVTKQGYFLWRTKTVTTHTERAFRVAIDDQGTLLVISCVAVSDVHIRDCRLILASVKQIKLGGHKSSLPA